jgi:hypothetical protein
MEFYFILLFFQDSRTKPELIVQVEDPRSCEAPETRRNLLEMVTNESQDSHSHDNTLLTAQRLLHLPMLVVQLMDGVAAPFLLQPHPPFHLAQILQAELPPVHVIPHHGPLHPAPLHLWLVVCVYLHLPVTPEVDTEGVDDELPIH